MSIYICQHVYSSDQFEYIAEGKRFVGWKSRLVSHLVHSRLYDDSATEGFLMISARTQTAMMFGLVDHYSVNGSSKILHWIYKPLKTKNPNRIYQMDYIDVGEELSKLSVTIHNDAI